LIFLRKEKITHAHQDSKAENALTPTGKGGGMVKRYDPEGIDAYMAIREEGGYVDFADYAALSAERDRLRESIEAIHMFRDAETLKAVEDQSEAVE
jgi:hypothetical protein